MSKSIQHTYFFNNPPADVWAYLTQPELIEQWLMKSDLKAEVGHQFNFLTTPMPRYGFDGIIYCTVLEVIPLEKLSYSWKGGSGNGAMALDSVVTWTLTAKDNGTELHLEHAGFKEMDNVMMFTTMSDGWLRNIGRIGELINSKA